MFSRLARPIVNGSRVLAPRMGVFGRGFSAMPRQVRSTGRFTAMGLGVTMGAVLLSQDQAECAGVDYNAVRKDIADILDNENWDDGGLGPVLVRLAWHASGTFSKEDGSGGSDGATMRFAPESGDGANAGLHHARAFLEPIKAKYPGISYADLWILAGIVAIEEMGGPSVPFRPGRSDKPDGSYCPPVGRLPDAAQGAQHLRDVFYRMGFNDQEIVALSGAHALGRCHTDRSGFSGPWTRAPTTFSNEYFRELLENRWTPKQWSGPFQYEDPTGDFMMLPTDLALTEDPSFRPYVELYARDSAKFKADFASAFQKLTENGVDFSGGASGSSERSGRFWVIAFLAAVGFHTVGGK